MMCKPCGARKKRNVEPEQLFQACYFSSHQQSISHSPIDDASQIIKAVSVPVLVVLNDIHHHKPLRNALICHPSMRSSEPRLLPTHTGQRPVHELKPHIQHTDIAISALITILVILEFLH